MTKNTVFIGLHINHSIVLLSVDLITSDVSRNVLHLMHFSSEVNLTRTPYIIPLSYNTWRKLSPNSLWYPV